MSSFYPKNPYRWGTQNYRLYERMKVNSITNAEIVKMGILKYTSRLSEIRDFVEKHGMTVKCTHVPGKSGLNEYSISLPY